LSDIRRMNVAMTRARRKLLMIGDTATLCTHPFYQRVIEYLENQSAYRTVDFGKRTGEADPGASASPAS
jgi:ATP-dependent RNA/DNA helicase IGHMBP2